MEKLSIEMKELLMLYTPIDAYRNMSRTCKDIQSVCRASVFMRKYVNVHDISLWEFIVKSDIRNTKMYEFVSKLYADRSPRLCVDEYFKDAMCKLVRTGMITEFMFLLCKGFYTECVMNHILDAGELGLAYYIIRVLKRPAPSAVFILEDSDRLINKEVFDFMHQEDAVTPQLRELEDTQ